MPSSLARRLDRLERAQPRDGAYRLAWLDQSLEVRLTSPKPVVPVPGQPLYLRKVVYPRYESQRIFDEMPCTFKGFSGPVGSGKSKALCHEVIKCCYLNPGVPGLLGAPTEKLLKASTLIELLSILDEQAIPYTYRKSANEVHLTEPNATILLRSLDNPESLRAMNLGWFGIDELTYCKEAAWLRLQGRIRNPDASYRRGFAVWTPRGHDWVWKRFISTSHKIENHAAVRAKPFENTAVIEAAPDYYENLKLSYDEKFYDQEVKGEYVDIYSGTVYRSFSEKNIRETSFNPKLPLIISMDFNTNPVAGLAMQYDGRTVKVLEEIVLPGSHTAAWCHRFVEVTIDRARAAMAMTGRPLEVRVYGDATGGAKKSSSGGDSDWIIAHEILSSRSEFQVIMKNQKSNPPVIDRTNAVNGMLCNSIEAGGDERRLYIPSSCRELLADFEEVKWKVDAHGNTYHEIDKSDPKRTHVSDALGYYIAEDHGYKDKVRFSRNTY